MSYLRTETSRSQSVRRLAALLRSLCLAGLLLAGWGCWQQFSRAPGVAASAARLMPLPAGGVGRAAAVVLPTSTATAVVEPAILPTATAAAQDTNPPTEVGTGQQAKGAALRRADDYDLRGLPSISVSTIERLLAAYHSPALGTGQGFFDLGVQYGIDPAFLLAFFVHESSAGTQGAAVANRSVGNIRCVQGYRCGGGYAAYDSWAQGAEHWYWLITQSGLYCGAGSERCTVAAIIPRYAPSADNNNEAAYIATVERLVAEWRAAER